MCLENTAVTSKSDHSRWTLKGLDWYMFSQCTVTLGTHFYRLASKGSGLSKTGLKKSCTSNWEQLQITTGSAKMSFPVFIRNRK